MLLQRLNAPFEVIASGVDEDRFEDAAPAGMVVGLARRKVELAARVRPDALVIGADTMVVLDGEWLGKPRDAADAWRMLALLRSRTHHVFTGVAVIDAMSGSSRRHACAATSP